MNPEEQRAENGEENNLEGKRDSSGESGVDRGEERGGGEQGSLSLVCYPEEIEAYMWGAGNCGDREVDLQLPCNQYRKGERGF